MTMLPHDQDDELCCHDCTYLASTEQGHSAYCNKTEQRIHSAEEYCCSHFVPKIVESKEHYEVSKMCDNLEVKINERNLRNHKAFLFNNAIAPAVHNASVNPNNISLD